jgi:heptosyltransferase I
MRVLIVKLSSFGDVVHTFPALTDLQAARPDVEVDWLVEEAFAPIAGMHPAVAEVHPVAYRRLRWSVNRWPALARHVWALRGRLRAREYDLVVDLQGLIKSAAFARLAGVPVDGFDLASAREPAAVRLYQRRHMIPKDLHAVDRSRRLLAAALGYDRREGTVAPRLARSDKARDRLELPERYGLILHAASWPTKLWPEDRWRRLVENRTGKGETVVLPWGKAEERARSERLANGVPGALVLPRVLVGAELVDLIAGASLAVGLDSGLMHLVAAFGVPGVWLYGPTDPALTGPYGERQIVVRSTRPEAPCFRRRCDRTPGGTCCMDAIAYAPVAEAVDALLATSPR